jgi:hypothetical protein
VIDVRLSGTDAKHIEEIMPETIMAPGIEALK